MKQCVFALVGFGMLAGAACSHASDLGKVDQKNPPSREELKAPKSDKGIEIVRLRGPVSGTAKIEPPLRVYVLVNPLSNKDTQDVWWVQDAQFADGKLTGTCQFGEGAAGIGEYFAIIAIATDKSYSTGDMITGLPRAALYSKLKIVKRE